MTATVFLAAPASAAISSFPNEDAANSPIRSASAHAAEVSIGFAKMSAITTSEKPPKPERINSAAPKTVSEASEITLPTIGTEPDTVTFSVFCVNPSKDEVIPDCIPINVR